ncbi:MAG: hypothetical protein FK733_11965 [Asgard group archaeon]|nr:hypothetical protein [Asgard group archaeon]
MTKKKTIISICILVLTFTVSLYSVLLYETQAASYQTTLDYGDDYHISSNKKYGDRSTLDWSFEGSDNTTGINVFVLDENNYTLYMGSNPAYLFNLSNGAEYTDSGVWAIPYYDIWHIVFLNQVNESSTTLTIEISFSRNLLARNELWYVIGITGIVVIVVSIIIFDQVRGYRKKKGIDSSAHGSPSSFDAESKTKMLTKLDKRESRIRRERILEGETLPELSELVIYFPGKNEKIDAVEVDVRGKTAIKSIVWVNNQAAFVDVDGSFIGTVLLYKGKNMIDVIAIGPHGKAMKSSVPINCTAKDAIQQGATGYSYMLPHHTLEIKQDDIPSPPPTPGADVQSVSVSKRKRDKEAEATGMDFVAKPTKKSDPIIASEAEIDPSVLAALKGDSIVEETPVIETEVSLDEIGPDSITPEIPPIPEIVDAEEEQKLPSIPDVVKEEETDEVPVIETDEAEIDESVKLLEEVIETEEETDEEEFAPDKMLPITKKDQIKDAQKKTTEDDLEEIKLDEFQPLKPADQGAQELVVETKIQELKDERSTIILQHNGLMRGENSELVQVLKIEKRIEQVKDKWFTTLGIVNISDIDISKLELCEYITNSMELTEKLPINVEEPIVDNLPEGVKITWVMNDIKSEAKVFITYSENINPLNIIKDEQKQPSIVIRK